MEEAGQALLRRTQDAGGPGLTSLGLAKGRMSQFHADAYEEHFLLVDDRVALLTNRCLMLLVAPGFRAVHAAAQAGASTTLASDIPQSQLQWAVRWQARNSWQQFHVLPAMYLLVWGPHCVQSGMEVFPWITVPSRQIQLQYG